MPVQQSMTTMSSSQTRTCCNTVRGLRGAELWWEGAGSEEEWERRDCHLLCVDSCFHVVVFYNTKTLMSSVKE
jgi:hypothetical protein